MAYEDFGRRPVLRPADIDDLVTGPSIVERFELSPHHGADLETKLVLEPGWNLDTGLDDHRIDHQFQIERLHQELNRLKGTSAQHGTVELTAKENSMIQHLAESGYTISEISRLTDYSETEIQASLDDSHPEAA